MWAIDHPSMILIIAAGLGLGVKAVFGFDVTQYFGNYANTIFLLVGIAATWQFTRQCFPI